MARYKVTLTDTERLELLSILNKGNHSSLLFRNAFILLNSDESEQGDKASNEQIARVLHINNKTVERLKQKFVEVGFESCIKRKS
jgi:hypothetical protein